MPVAEEDCDDDADEVFEDMNRPVVDSSEQKSDDNEHDHQQQTHLISNCQELADKIVSVFCIMWLL